MDNHKGYYLDAEKYVHNDIKNYDKADNDKVYNDGIKKRAKTYLNMDDPEVLKFRNISDVKKEQMNYTKVLTSKKKRVYYTNLYIKMSNISDFFAKLPLCTGFDCKLIINVN